MQFTAHLKTAADARMEPTANHGLPNGPFLPRTSYVRLQVPLTPLQRN